MSRAKPRQQSEMTKSELEAFRRYLDSRDQIAALAVDLSRILAFHQAIARDTGFGSRFFDDLERVEAHMRRAIAVVEGYDAE